MSHGAGIGPILGLIILILVPFIPFTEQFAREPVPRSLDITDVQENQPRAERSLGTLT